ncbi:N-methyl-L-tryptophan oxidase [Labrys monachus]|uniref:Sarcosine oxidase n=1 Tax=Labrys monachus TaxID=217067 RepID=A0ABU0FHN2_9HYPH|nr:N-methyl-L-tryptophan oxidase [Labrys monachus]MDQ0393644.1 sarcosine oxidase [Labrys monachus]
MPQEFDVAVVGLGAMGAATLYQATTRGATSLGIDRFRPPHARGASHGNSRVTREAVGEGADYVPLVMRSHRIVAELERELGETFLVRSGTLIIGSQAAGGALHGAPDFVAGSIAMARRFGIEHEILDAGELRRRYPQFRTIRDADRGYFEPNAGYMRPEALIDAQIAGACRAGATVLPDTVVERIGQAGDRVRIETNAGAFAARHLVVAAGAWTRKLLGPPYDGLLTVTRQVVRWYAVEDPSSFRPEKMPVFMWFVSERPGDYFTGFPVADPAEGLKIITSDDGPDIDHEAMEPADIEASLAFHARLLAPNIAGVRPKVVANATCFYTNTPHRGFVIDRHPAMDRVTVICACSGHGFKHSLAIGEAVAQTILEGRSTIDLAPFALSRLKR